jgi:hypothetical protein
MLLLFAGFATAGKVVFVVSLFSLLASLGISLYEIFLSVDALNLELKDFEKRISDGNLQGR